MKNQVTIGIPTYNRAKYLRRALESAVNQTYKNLEIIVSDNASTDDTAEICKEFAMKYSNFKYFRHDSNRGGTLNFVSVLEKAHSEYFMWLGDDDWLDLNYVEECLKIFAAEPDVSLVGGVAYYYKSSVFTRIGWAFELNSRCRFFRVLKYYWTCKDNGLFYGLHKREQVANALPGNVLCGDYFTIAAVAFLGRVRVARNTKVHRELGGVGDGFFKVSRGLGLSIWNAIFPYTHIAMGAWNAAMRLDLGYERFGSLRKYIFATLIFFVIWIQGANLFLRRLIPPPIKRRLRAAYDQFKYSKLSPRV